MLSYLSPFHMRCCRVRYGQYLMTLPRVMLTRIEYNGSIVMYVLGKYMERLRPNMYDQSAFVGKTNLNNKCGVDSQPDILAKVDLWSVANLFLKDPT